MLLYYYWQLFIFKVVSNIHIDIYIEIYIDIHTIYIYIVQIYYFLYIH